MNQIVDTNPIASRNITYFSHLYRAMLNSS